jgi:hypothetical protein
LSAAFLLSPSLPRQKRPIVKWKSYQEVVPDEDDIDHWKIRSQEQGIDPADLKLAIITGKLSGVVVVDCDSKEAMDFCRTCGVWSPIRVRTKNGIHLYFRHDGVNKYGPRVGSKSRGTDWPQLDGLDFRGDGSYALCPPSHPYEWEFDTDIGLDEIDEWPVWKGWPIEDTPDEYLRQVEIPLQQGSGNSFASLDLSTDRVIDYRTEWHKTQAYVSNNFPDTGKIPSDMGNGRNMRVLQHASEMIRSGKFGQELEESVCEFMDEFFVERLDQEAWKATCRSVEQMERTNHPERFDDQGNYIYRRPEIKFKKDGTVETEDFVQEFTESVSDSQQQGFDEDLYTPDEIQEIVKDAKMEYLVTPLIRKNSIHHISGYTGQGKSTLIQMFTHASAAGRARMGPFTIEKPYRTLYLNFEEGQITLRQRGKDFEQIIGPLHNERVKDVVMYHSSISKKGPMNLEDKAGRQRLYKMIAQSQPDLIVIDTIRSAFPNIDENDKNGWALINKLLVALRNKGFAIIILHHSNKPNDKGLGSFAGSTHQLTNVELQYYTAIMYEEERQARNKGGVYDEKRDEEPNVHDEVYAHLTGGRVDWKVQMLLRVSSAKARDEDQKADREYYIARVVHLASGEQQIVHLPTTTDRFLTMYLQGRTIYEIAATLGKPVATIEEWVDDYKRANGTT